MSYFPELTKELEEVKDRLKGCQNVVVTIIEQPKATICVQIRVKATEKTRRAIDIYYGKEVYRKPNDEDLKLCRSVIEVTLLGLHMVCKKCYERRDCVEYYIRPDWKWWYSK